MSAKQERELNAAAKTIKAQYEEIAELKSRISYLEDRCGTMQRENTNLRIENKRCRNTIDLFEGKTDDE